MTFKKIVAGLVGRSADRWVRDLIGEGNFDWTSTGSVSFDLDGTVGNTYTVEIEVVAKQGYSYKKTKLFVGGSVDEYNIYNSVIWDANHNIIWMSVEKTREDLGITEFKIS